MASKRKAAPRALRLPSAEVGILGGTGLYEIEGMEVLREVRLKTPFGDPSDAFFLGRLGGRGVAFLSRHGRGHRHSPSDVNYRANIYGFKLLGVERIVSVNSCGSLKEEIRPRDIMFADQFFDRTRRPSTFFGRGVVAHVGLANPVCGDLAGVLFETGRDLGLRVHPRGTYLNMEGPAFSTKAESRIYRSWGCDVIGMTSATEARLAREAEICYATMNLVTDYDVWHEEEGPVSVEMILENLRANIHNARAVIKAAMSRIVPQGKSGCDCGRALKNGIVTDRRLMPASTRRILLPLIGKYLKD
ncbi:MAG: methylthioadenosine phosphorylase [Candidatus Aminicenantes bacterium RBG_13_62_12]|nr:MAG: methylthioadenosine phosphorylase [Candidatus Aminicenantes bacterium RBG_13_62_12]